MNFPNSGIIPLYKPVRKDWDNPSNIYNSSMESIEKKVLCRETEEIARAFFMQILDVGIEFKLQNKVRKKIMSDTTNLQSEKLPDSGESLEVILTHFTNDVLPYCTNFSSRSFMGFPDTGNSIAAIGGSLLQEFLQQNLINQSFCSPSGTFIEIAVLRWLREVVGYKNINEAEDVWDVGGVITPGGTVSNAIAMLLARENKSPGTLESGVSDPSKFKIIVPKGIGHYSVKSAQMWIGCGSQLIEVETRDFRYDLTALESALVEHKGSVMALIAYAGDSRTMTVDNLSDIAALTRRIDPTIWLHADACHGFSLGFSNTLRHKIKGIEDFDSISADPHKVMLTPYTVSALLVREPKSMRTITSKSDLIMQERFAFGQITPFLGSKSWLSLKLWFMMRNFGKAGLDELITKRHGFAVSFANKLKENPDFLVLNEVEINSVAFFYTGGQVRSAEEVNAISKAIHERMQQEGDFHLHQFSIPDGGLLDKGVILYPLRFMCGNPLAASIDLDNLIGYISRVGTEEIKLRYGK